MDVTQFVGGGMKSYYGGATNITSSGVMPNVLWQNTSSGATYASASNIITLKR